MIGEEVPMASRPTTSAGTQNGANICSTRKSVSITFRTHTPGTYIGLFDTDHRFAPVLSLKSGPPESARTMASLQLRTDNIMCKFAPARGRRARTGEPTKWNVVERGQAATVTVKAFPTIP